MKAIISIFLFASYGLIQLQLAVAYLNRHCDGFNPKSLEIPDNPFVKPGKRANSTVWYDSVNWVKIPPGQTMVNFDVIAHQWGKASRVRSFTPFDLYLQNTDDNDGSFASILRSALGIPRYSDPVKGTRELDPLMFSSKPCLIFYTNFLMESKHQYTVTVTTTTRAYGKSHALLKGALIKPDH